MLDHAACYATIAVMHQGVSFTCVRMTHETKTPHTQPRCSMTARKTSLLLQHLMVATVDMFV